MKKIIWLIIAGILTVFVIIFSLQNNTPVAVKLLSREFDTSLAWVVFITLLIGILSGFLMMLPKIIGLKLRLRKTEKKLNAFEKEKALTVDKHQKV